MSTDHSKLTRGPEKLQSQVIKKADNDQFTFTPISSGNISVSIPVPVHLIATSHLHTINIDLILPDHAYEEVQDEVNNLVHSEIHQVPEIVPSN